MDKFKKRVKRLDHAHKTLAPLCTIDKAQKNKANYSKLIIIGSGYEAIEWLDNNEIYKNIQITAINNAWRLVIPKYKFIWCHSTNHLSLHKPPPPNNKIIREVTSYNSHPYWYNMGCGTMLLNVLYHFINEHINDDLVIGIVGANLDFSGKITHFYGQGRKDPLVHGTDRLINELLKIKALCSKSLIIINLSPTPNTLLPFAQQSYKSFIHY